MFQSSTVRRWRNRFFCSTDSFEWSRLNIALLVCWIFLIETDIRIIHFRGKCSCFYLCVIRFGWIQSAAFVRWSRLWFCCANLLLCDFVCLRLACADGEIRRNFQPCLCDDPCFGFPNIVVVRIRAVHALPCKMVRDGFDVCVSLLLIAKLNRIKIQCNRTAFPLVAECRVSGECPLECWVSSNDWSALASIQNHALFALLCCHSVSSKIC